MTGYTHRLGVQRVGFGNGGWCRLHATLKPDGPFVLVRLEDRAGRLRVVEFYVRGEISDYTFDRLAPRRVEDLLNEPRAAHSIRSRLQVPGVDLATASGYYAGGVGATDDNGRGVTWVDEMFLAQLPAAMRNRPKDEGALRKRQVFRHAEGSFVVEGVIRPAEADDNRVGAGLIAPREPGQTFDVPTTRVYPPAFYEAVAAVYRDAVAWQLGSPAVAVKEQCRTEVPMTTVYRWIRAARDRGLLTSEPGRGRACA